MTFKRLAILLILSSALTTSAYATHDSGDQTSLLAASNDGRVALVLVEGLGEGEVLRVDVYHVGNANPVESFNCAHIDPYDENAGEDAWAEWQDCQDALPIGWEALPKELVNRLSLEEPPVPALCNEDGACIKFQLENLGLVPLPEDFEPEFEEQATRYRLDVVLEHKGQSTVLLQKELEDACDADLGTMTNELSVHWLSSTTATLTGAFYTENPCQWGNYDAVFEFIDIDTSMAATVPEPGRGARGCSCSSLTQPATGLPIESGILVVAMLGMYLRQRWAGHDQSSNQGQP